MKNKKQVIIALVALVVAAAVFVGVYFAFRPQGTPGDKNITVVVVHKDGSENTFNYNTSEEFLEPVLVANNLVQGEESQYGLYIKYADGERADYTLDGAWWGIYVGDEQSMVGANELAIEDGGVYKLVYSVG